MNGGPLSPERLSGESGWPARRAGGCAVACLACNRNGQCLFSSTTNGTSSTTGPLGCGGRLQSTARTAAPNATADGPRTHFSTRSPRKTPQEDGTISWSFLAGPWRTWREKALSSEALSHSLFRDQTHLARVHHGAFGLRGTLAIVVIRVELANQLIQVERRFPNLAQYAAARTAAANAAATIHGRIISFVFGAAAIELSGADLHNRPKPYCIPVSLATSRYNS